MGDPPKVSACEARLWRVKLWAKQTKRQRSVTLHALEAIIRQWEEQGRQSGKMFIVCDIPDNVVRRLFATHRMRFVSLDGYTYQVTN